MYNQEGTTMEEQKTKQRLPEYVTQIYAESKALTVEPYMGDKDCERHITADRAIEICDKAINCFLRTMPNDKDIEKLQHIYNLLDKMDEHREAENIETIINKIREVNGWR